MEFKDQKNTNKEVTQGVNLFLASTGYKTLN